MKILEKEGYKYSIFGSIMIIGISIVILILTLVLFKVEGIGIGSFQIYQITIIILSGMVVPSIIFALSFVGNRQYLKSKKIPLIFGIAIIAMGIILVVISGIWSGYMLEFIEIATLGLGLAIAIIICLFMGIITLIIATYGGIQNIMYWKQNK